MGLDMKGIYYGKHLCRKMGLKLEKAGRSLRCCYWSGRNEGRKERRKRGREGGRKELRLIAVMSVVLRKFQ